MEVSPSTLEFKGSFTKPTTEYLTLSNTSSSPLAFKVKTTAPKLYCVRPNASVVAPGATIKVSIILQGFSSPLPKDFKCKDKFLIVSLPCPDLDDVSKVGEIWSSLEAKYKEQLVSKKLRVSYIITDEEEAPEAPTSSSGAAAAAAAAPVEQKSVPTNGQSKSVPETSSSAPVTGAVAGAVTGAAASAAAAVGLSEKPADNLQKELDASNAQVNNLSEKLDSNESPVPKANAPSTSSQQEPVTGVSLPFAVILILIAFLLGWLIF